MILNSTSLTTLYVGFKTTFQQAFDGVKPQYKQVAMVVPSTTKAEEYGWLGQFPRIREWIGDRVVNGLAVHDFRIKNKHYEFTVGVDKNDLDDDTYGIYSPMMSEIGRSAASFPDELVWPLLKNGHQTLCYDGQNFFDTDHPVLDEAGKPISVSNYGGGAGDFWCLLDTSRAIKPVIFQNRKNFEFTRMDAAVDEVVFTRKEYRYGTDGRCNAGFGFWQLAHGSRQALTASAYSGAREAMIGMKGDYGKPLGIMPNLLVVGPGNEEAARTLLMSEKLDGGGTNPWKGTAELLVVPWLA